MLAGLQRILSFQELKENWNDNGAKPFSQVLLQDASKLLLSLSSCPEPEIFPTATQGIQFEWETKTAYLEIVLYETEITVFAIKNGKDVFDLSLQNTHDYAGFDLWIFSLWKSINDEHL